MSLASRIFLNSHPTWIPFGDRNEKYIPCFSSEICSTDFRGPGIQPISRVNPSRVAKSRKVHHTEEGLASGPSNEGSSTSCRCHPTCAFLIRVALPVLMRCPCNTHASHGHALVWTARADHVAEQ